MVNKSVTSIQIRIMPVPKDMIYNYDIASNIRNNTYVQP